jgi:uncharacterized protein (DUF302 family)
MVLALMILIGAALHSNGNAGPANGVVRVESAYSVDETVSRILADIKEKGITFFAEIDQSGLGTAAGVEGLNASKLILFGNPALGTTFITGNAEAGLDWPVRVLVFATGDGNVMVAYNDFNYIAKRHNIDNRDEQFAMATTVIRSVLDSVKK